MLVFSRSWQLLQRNFQIYAGLGVKSSCGVAIPKRTTCWEGHLLPLLRISCDLTAIGSEYDSMTSWPKNRGPQDLWNDFTALHQNERTDLEKQEHRNYFGEMLRLQEASEQI